MAQEMSIDELKSSNTGLQLEVARKNAKIAELQREVERLYKSERSYMDLSCESQLKLKIAEEALKTIKQEHHFATCSRIATEALEKLK